ncbi:MAG: DNA-3-methyladenine glycosylase [Candidatus Dormibacteraeota bacterium]|nr:DNA-3-methyladenine glycosylase [Candidatus Dormibacteraeota bacterium]
MTEVGPRLGRRFFARSSPEVARELVGCWLVRRGPNGLARLELLEVEAYLGESDPASHAHRGPTPRNLPMYGPAGHAYVYFIYGMHHCLNVVTGPAGEAEAVLLRAGRRTSGEVVGGPALLCRALGVTLADNRVDLCSESADLWLEAGAAPQPVESGPRVGVRDPAPLRYYLAGTVRGKRGAGSVARSHVSPVL